MLSAFLLLNVGDCVFDLLRNIKAGFQPNAENQLFL